MRAILLGLIRVYQVATAWRPSPCRYRPTCSEYARGAIQAHGAWRGSGLAVRDAGLAVGTVLVAFGVRTPRSTGGDTGTGTRARVRSATLSCPRRSPGRSSTVT